MVLFPSCCLLFLSIVYCVTFVRFLFEFTSSCYTLKSKFIEIYMHGETDWFRNHHNDRNDIGCTKKIKTLLSFFFFLLSDPLSFFFPILLFFLCTYTIDERVQIEKCGKFKRNKDSNSKDKAKQT